MAEDPAARITRLNRELQAGRLGWEPGHFYSPLPDLVDIHRREAAIFTPPADVPGVNLNLARQLELLEQLAGQYAGLPFTEQKQPGLRYYFDNPNFSYGESIVLYCLIKLLKPKRIVEIGSGHSSCVILDTNQRCFDGAIDCSFVEPYPELLLSLMDQGDRKRTRVLGQRVQEVSLDLFTQLAPGDILFVDSSHVSKVGSDVNYIFFEILPRLAPGVYVHFHDIMAGFEYPSEWIYQGRAWNEAYLMRSFLQYNSAFSIELFNSYLGHFHRAALIRALPLADRNPGTSLWLKKTGHGPG
jgi:hypothetical protein